MKWNSKFRRNEILIKIWESKTQFSTNIKSLTGLSGTNQIEKYAMKIFRQEENINYQYGVPVRTTIYNSMKIHKLQIVP